MIGFIVVDGISSRDFGFVLSDVGIYGIAERDDEVVSVPGRNGDLVFSNNRFKNVKISYPVASIRNFSKDFPDFMGFILSHDGYMRLEDSFYPDYFMQARYTGETSPSKVTLDDSGVFVLSFERKPQKWLKSGEKWHIYTTDGSIYNPTRFRANPIVRVYGSGSVGIGANTITIDTSLDYVDIDCEIQNAYHDTVNCNNQITLSSGKFFELPNGLSGVTLGTGISKVEIIPRWWTL